MGLLRDFMDQFEKRRHLKWIPPVSDPAPRQPEPIPDNGSYQADPKETYTNEERDLIERYIGDAFGPITRTFYDTDQEKLRIDIAVTEPSERRRFYTLTTIGMGAHRMRVPQELEEKNRAFAELTVCLPPDWDIMNDSWPFHMLQETARFPFADHHGMLGVGSAYHGALMRGSGFDAAFVIPAATRRGISTRLMLPSGKIVNYYLLLPIYEDEWNYIVSRQDSSRFWERYSEHVGSIVVDPERESCVGGENTEEETEWNT